METGGRCCRGGGYGDGGDVAQVGGMPRWRGKFVALFVAGGDVEAAGEVRGGVGAFFDVGAAVDFCRASFEGGSRFLGWGRGMVVVSQRFVTGQAEAPGGISAARMSLPGGVWEGGSYAV